MKRKVFFSFHYKSDSWRVSQVKNMGVIEGDNVLQANKWEEVESQGEQAIKDWIDNQLKDKSCLVVLVGEKTYRSKWVRYEIKKAWAEKKGVLGIRVHHLKGGNKKPSKKGKNPFERVKICNSKRKLSNIVELKSSRFRKSENVYGYIKDNIEQWVEEAIKIRKSFQCK